MHLPLGVRRRGAPASLRREGKGFGAAARWETGQHLAAGAQNSLAPHRILGGSGRQFQFEVPIPDGVASLLVAGEQPVAAYKTMRDTAIFTNKRLIVRDSQGMTGKKVEVYSLPYTAINMWSSENAGTFDLSSEIELWTRAGHITIKLGSKIDVRRLDQLIAWAVLADK